MKRGFTLAEVLVVLAVLLVLAAFLSPVIGQARESSRASVCISNLHQISVAMDIYRTDANLDGIYGPAADMGLPLDLHELASEQQLPPKLFACAATNMLSTRNLYNLMYLPDGSYGRMSWTQYVEQVGDSAVVIADYNHELKSSLHQSPFMTHRGIGLYLDGHVRVTVRKGDWFSYEWWTPREMN